MRHTLNASTAHAVCVATAFAALASGCRRDAKAPLNPQSLFPDAGVSAMAPPPSAAGTLARAELVLEREPNDRPDEAQPISNNALIEGFLATPPSAEPQPKPAKGRKAHTPLRTDADWYRLAAIPPGQLMQIDLREGPPGALLELYDDAGKTLIARARARAGVRAVLPSIGPDAHASLIRVTSDDGTTGAYKLAVFTRPMRPDEEVEPNGVPRQTSQALVAGQSLQGTLAPEGDVDVFALDFSTAPGVDVWVLSVTAVPGVAMELTLLDPATLEPLLTRKSLKDGGIVVPDLAPSRLPKRTLVQLKALSGQAPDQPYVLTLTPLLPAGCAKQADCLDRLPAEREPNETRMTAQQVPAGKPMTGFSDSAGDVDALELTCPPGAVVRLVATPPQDATLLLQVGDGPDTLHVEGAGPGAPVVIAGVLVSTGRLGVLLRAKGEGMKPTEPWRLDSTVLAEPQFELEAGDETKLPTLLAPEHALVRVPPNAQLPLGGWQRAGALVPAGDVDAFSLDLRTHPGPQGLELLCAGDGAPGLACKVLDARGQELAHLAAGEPNLPSHAPLSVAPGVYTLVVSADKPRASMVPYHLTLRDAPELAQLPSPGTATDSPLFKP